MSDPESSKESWIRKLIDSTRGPAEGLALYTLVDYHHKTLRVGFHSMPCEVPADAGEITNHGGAGQYSGLVVSMAALAGCTRQSRILAERFMPLGSSRQAMEITPSDASTTLLSRAGLNLARRISSG